MNRGLIYVLLLLNASVLAGVLVMILWVILTTTGVDGFHHRNHLVVCSAAFAFAISALALVPVARKISHRGVWSHPHFSGAQPRAIPLRRRTAGIFSFFINYMTSQVPPIPPSKRAMNSLADHAGFMHNWLTDWFKTDAAGVFEITTKAPPICSPWPLSAFLWAAPLRRPVKENCGPQNPLPLWFHGDVIVTILIFFKLGWFSVVCVFLSFLFMSIMFPTIFALGIFGLGPRTKRASAYLVMAIMGGAMLPKLMGHVADKHGMSRGFIVPMFCFVLIALYGFLWPRFSNATSLQGAVGDRNGGGASAPDRAST